MHHEFTFYLQLSLKLVQRIILLAYLGAHTLRLALHKVNHQISLKCRNNSQFSSFQWRRSVVGETKDVEFHLT